MATPSEYADRYRNLQVGFDDGDVKSPSSDITSAHRTTRRNGWCKP